MDYLKSLQDLRKEHQSYRSATLRKLYDMWYEETFGKEELKDEYKLNLAKLQTDFVIWVIQTNPNNVVTKTAYGWMFEPLACTTDRNDVVYPINSTWVSNAEIFTGDCTCHISYKLCGKIYYTIFTVEHWPELIPFTSSINLKKN
jgi:hypothetical protein